MRTITMRKGGRTMVNTTVRIDSVEIRNFKNIGYGHLDFEDSKKGSKASILGLYGQNGSGKTALIDALELLRLALSGRAIPAYFADYINVDSEYATLKYGFKVSNQKTDCMIILSITQSSHRLMSNTKPYCLMKCFPTPINAEIKRFAFHL